MRRTLGKRTSASEYYSNVTAVSRVITTRKVIEVQQQLRRNICSIFPNSHAYRQVALVMAVGRRQVFGCSFDRGSSYNFF